MGEPVGMIRPELQALPQIRERMTFIYLEHSKLNREDSAITAADERGTVYIPAASFPRTRGGDPYQPRIRSKLQYVSPQTRG